MPRRTRPGRPLEQLVAAIERSLGQRETTTVESPAFVPDRITGETREHDVLITVVSAHHRLRIAVECRDRSRKVTVNDVEAFERKCADTGISQGVMVCPRGFTRSALRKAAHNGIRTLRLAEAASFTWLATTGITGTTRTVNHVGWMFEPDPKFDPLPEVYTVLMPDGSPVNTDHLMSAARTEFSRIPYEDTPPPGGVKVIIFPTPGVTLRDDSSGATHPIGRAIVEVQYTTATQFLPFRLVKYTDDHSGGTITDAAIADVTLGKFAGKMMVVYKEEAGGRVLFVPDAPAGASLKSLPPSS